MQFILSQPSCNGFHSWPSPFKERLPIGVFDNVAFFFPNQQKVFDLIVDDPRNWPAAFILITKNAISRLAGFSLL